MLDAQQELRPSREDRGVKAPGERAERAYRLGLAAIVVAGLALRLRGAQGALLLNDELHAARAALALGPWEILTTHAEADGSIPLSLYAWMLARAGALSEWTLRLPVLASGALLPLAAWGLAPRVGRPAAVLAAALLAAWPPFVHYSVVARPYAPALLVSLATLVAWCRWREAPTRARRWAFGLGAALSVFLQVFAVFPVAALFAVAAAARGERAPRLAEVARAARVAAGAFLVLFAPGLPSFLAVHAGKVGAAEWSDRTASVLAQSLGAGSAPAAAALAALALAGAALLARRDGALAAACVLAPLLVAGGLLAVGPEGTAHAWTRYLLLGLPHVVVLAGIALAAPLEALARRRPSVAPRAGAAAAAAALALVAATWLLSPARLYRRQPDSFRTARNVLLAEVPPRDVAGVYARLDAAAGGAEGAVIECPLPGELAELSPFPHAQRVHGRRVLLGVLATPGTPYLGDVRGYVNLLEEEAVPRSGARFVVLHDDLLPEMPAGVRGALRADVRWQTRLARDVLRARCGPPLLEGDGVEVYDAARWDAGAGLDPDALDRRLRQRTRGQARRAAAAAEARRD